MNSYNHFAYGAVVEWMYAYMAGIKVNPQKGGFQDFILQPTMDTGEPYNDEERIRSVDGMYDSYYGTIQSFWTADDDRALLAYHAQAPTNTKATLYLPVTEAQMENFEDIPGVTYLYTSQL